MLLSRFNEKTNENILLIAKGFFEGKVDFGIGKVYGILLFERYCILSALKSKNHLGANRVCLASAFPIWRLGTSRLSSYTKSMETGPIFIPNRKSKPEIQTGNCCGGCRLQMEYQRWTLTRNKPNHPFCKDGGRELETEFLKNGVSKPEFGRD